jgi:hypothetical protein
MVATAGLGFQQDAVLLPQKIVVSVSVGATRRVRETHVVADMPHKAWVASSGGRSRNLWLWLFINMPLVLA